MGAGAERLFTDRHADPKAVVTPPGFRAEVVATGLNNPSSVDSDEAGNVYIGEMGSPAASAYEGGRIVRIRADGSSEVVADNFSGSLTGLAYYNGAFFVAEHAKSSRIYRVFEDGTIQPIVTGLPGGGDHPTSDVVVSHSEKIYFGQGTRTNSGVVGPDNAAWLTDHRELTDVPGANIVLAGRNFECPDPFGPGTVSTGAFKPFAVRGDQDETIRRNIKCSGSIMRADPDGGELELSAWGLRRPFGISVHADGRIFCADIGMEDRGSRRIADGRSYLWQVVEHRWYGWPDYAGGEPITNPKFQPQTCPQPEFLLKKHPRIQAEPVAKLPSGSGAAKFDFARSPFFGSDDTAFVALMGDIRAADHTPTQNPRVVALDVGTGTTADFLTNEHPGPASAYQSGGLERPIAAKFDRTGEAMYVLDLGILYTAPDTTIRTLPNTGVLWRISISVLS